jgi:hypothetical protein
VNSEKLKVKSGRLIGARNRPAEWVLRLLLDKGPSTISGRFPCRGTLVLPMAYQDRIGIEKERNFTLDARVDWAEGAVFSYNESYLTLAQKPLQATSVF